MREIKYRQAIFSNKKFSYFHYWGFLSSGHFVSPETNSSTIEGAKEHSQQFTGLHDKNGVEIFEGDILEHEDFKNKKQRCWGVMEWDENNACFSRFYPLFKFEVIGNVHEHSHLLVK